MSFCAAACGGRASALVRGLLFVAVLALLGICGSPAQASTVMDLKNAIRAELSRINGGMTDFYSALGVTPTVQQQFCTLAISNKAPGLSLTTESLFAPYSLLATDDGLVIFKENYVFGPSIELIGASATTDGILTTEVQRGSSIVVPYKANTIIFVVGVMMDDRNRNILPMARYMIVHGDRCNNLNMDVDSLYSNTFRAVLTAMAQ
ncbi:hypothetical protein JKF63_06772 [Porcisia hertigi]|uniref:Uncharacterized protein n=1 Tax=Porcisia hertigi TaxID=2761500 RepID=A0A836INC6_9TRYP|nr:hypothetical protein JKF63_06772 [Porcisia hertigi]